MSEIPAVTAIIVTFNSAGVIAQALASVQRQPEITAIIVVDNCSADETLNIIERDFPHVTLIAHTVNDGYGRANNIALRRVETPYALLVNPDTVLKEGMTHALLAASARYPDAAILAPLLYDEHGKLDHSHKRNIFTREKKRDIYTQPSGDCCAEFLSGAIWLLKMQLIKPLGFFDENIFLYYEDDDLCLRARRAGHGLLLVHDAGAIHLKGRSSGAPELGTDFFKQQTIVWSRLYIEEKYRGTPASTWLALKLQFQYACKIAWYKMTLKSAKENRYRGRLAGVFAFNGQSGTARK